MTDASQLQQKLASQLKRARFFSTSRVESAFCSVKRHLFLPDVPLKQVYNDDVVITKRGDKGQPISSSSQPAMMAIMLEQLDLKPGHSVLEIGAGTGYNAALMAHIVGDSGSVTTIDIDEDIVDTARNNLVNAGFTQVQVVCADGESGYIHNAPYDRIILTVGAWDIAPAWYKQLKPDGRLVLPLTLKDGEQASVAFEIVDNYLKSMDASSCGFMPLRGNFAHPQSENTKKNLVTRIYQLIQPILFIPFYFLTPEQRVKLYNLQTFGHFDLESIQIRVYPQEYNYIPKENEFIIVKHYNIVVLNWR